MPNFTPDKIQPGQCVMIFPDTDGSSDAVTMMVTSITEIRTLRGIELSITGDVVTYEQGE